MDSIVIRGAREHNLQNVDLDLPRDKFVVVTGVSGSGKSSLAFDTIYAEGQRRYVESLSAYARQFLEQQGKPDVDTIEGLSPAISIEQKSASRNPRSTVGTVTEIYDYLRLLFARIGVPHCYLCGKPIRSQTVQQMVDQVLELPMGSRFAVLAPIVRGRKGEYRKELASLRKEGFVRVNIDGELRDLSEEIVLDKKKQHTIEVYVDRLALKAGIDRRLTDSVEIALKLSGGLVKISLLDGKDMLFSERLACIDDGISYPEMTPRFFSFNNPQGACTGCGGLGVKMYFDPELVIPEPEQPVMKAIAPMPGLGSPWLAQIFDGVAGAFGFDLDTAWQKLPAAARKVLLEGSGGEEIDFVLSGKRGSKYKFKRAFEGILPMLERRYRETESASFREDAEELMTRRACPDCDGTRLRKEALAVTIARHNVHEVTSKSVGEAREFFAGLKLSKRDRLIAERLLREINDRLQFLEAVGLEYLTLDRSAATLSGGEAQRIRLATQIGSALVGVLYVLDEPSIGLHPRDNARLLSTLTRLRDLGNTVLVVEHDEETIRAADHVVDMGPGAGVLGGRVVAQGTPEEITASEESVTGQFLSRRRFIPVPSVRRTPTKKAVTVQGATANNLKDLDVSFPLGVLTVVTGVSGSGKSTLVIDTLLRAVQNNLRRHSRSSGMYRSIKGVGQLDRVIDIDQSPIGRTPRSNPATYTQLFGPIRDLFAQLPESKVRGYKPGRYSFNVKGGRCEACQGDGVLRIEMHFLPDVFVECEVCGGSRYNRETLEVRYKGKSIAEVLAMTVEEGLEFLAPVPRVARILETLQAVGLGYLQLGQSATTLSGGEAQRIKLSRELAKRSTGSTLYILDEPTTGLHFADVVHLLEVLGRLVDAGNTVVVIEHNLDVIKTADWIIDLGPEGGDKGGEVLVTGPPELVVETPASYTGQALAPVLAEADARKASGPGRRGNGRPRSRNKTTARTRSRKGPLQRKG